MGVRTALELLIPAGPKNQPSKRAGDETGDETGDEIKLYLGDLTGEMEAH
jgi:hypothetical protein